MKRRQFDYVFGNLRQASARGIVEVVKVDEIGGENDGDFGQRCLIALWVSSTGIDWVLNREIVIPRIP